MPHIFVSHDLPTLMGESGRASFLTELSRALPAIVADFLSSGDEGGGLTENDISVTFLPKGEFDTLTHRLEIRIEAGLFPGRLANVDERADKIRHSLELGLGHHEAMRGQPFKLNFYVWVRLSPAGFSSGEIAGSP